MRPSLQEVGLVRRDAAEGAGGADAGDRAFVAVHAAVVPHLEKDRAVAELGAALDADGAANAAILVDAVFVEGVFDESAFDGTDGAELVLRRGVLPLRLGVVIAAAELAVAAERVGVDGPRRRRRPRRRRPGDRA